jgi:hypothetical protein
LHQRRGVYWTESRRRSKDAAARSLSPHGGEPADVVPPGFNVPDPRPQYSGGAAVHATDPSFSAENFDADSRLYRIDEARRRTAQPITQEPPRPHALEMMRRRPRIRRRPLLIVCVRGRTATASPSSERSLSCPRTDRPTAVIASGRDFYAAPR